MNLTFFILATSILVYRAISHKSLTPLGVVSAVVTATVHAVHPWNLPFALLITFYFLAVAATKVKHEVKEGLTLSSDGKKGGEGPRTHIQVLANSIAASILTFLHAYQLGVFSSSFPSSSFSSSYTSCFKNDILIIGIIANYASTLADTLSSELGILSKSQPRLITTLRPTPKGTNGGVTSGGLLAAAAGGAAVGLVSVLLLPVCREQEWSFGEKMAFVGFVTGLGTMGSLLDSLLGAVFQESVVDVRSGKVVEAPGGVKVLVNPGSTILSTPSKLRSHLSPSSETPEAAIASPDASNPRHRLASNSSEKTKYEEDGDIKLQPSRIVVAGNRFGVLSNNQVNLAMAVLMSLGTMAGAGWWWG